MTDSMRGALEADSTLYLDRFSVRKILIGQLDEHLHITEGILADVDALPIFTKADLAIAASAPPAAGQTERELAAQAALARVRKVRDGYADQAKFADVDQASYFREFVRRLDDAVNPKPSAPPWNGAAIRREAPAPSRVVKIGGTALCGHGVMAAICEVCNRPDAGGGVRVKPLEWRGPISAYPTTIWEAKTAFGHFVIEEVSASDAPAYEVLLSGAFVSVKDGVDGAKAAAQADYEERILSAIVQDKAQIPQGYALVPVKPTPAMIEAGCEHNPTQWDEGTDIGFAADVANDVYVAMVRSALSTPPAAAESNASVEARLREALEACVDRLVMVAERRMPNSNGFIPRVDAAIAFARSALSAGDEAKKSEGGR